MDRWVRSAALITALTFTVLAASTIYGLAHLVGNELPLSGPDARLAIYCLLFGLATLLLLSLLSTASEDRDREDSAPAFTRWSGGFVAFWLAVYLADGVLSASYDPKSTAVLWVTMVTLFVGWDWFQAGADRRADLRITEMRSLAVRKLRRQEGGRLGVCRLEVADLEQRRVIAWAFVAPQRDRIVLDISAGRTLAEWANDRPMTATKDGRATKVEFRDSALNGASLALRNRKPLREMRQDPIGKQRRGYTVGLIEIPRSELAKIGVLVSVVEPGRR